MWLPPSSSHATLLRLNDPCHPIASYRRICRTACSLSAAVVGIDRMEVPGRNNQDEYMSIVKRRRCLRIGGKVVAYIYTRPSFGVTSRQCQRQL